MISTNAIVSASVLLGTLPLSEQSAHSLMIKSENLHGAAIAFISMSYDAINSKPDHDDEYFLSWLSATVHDFATCKELGYV